MPDIMPSSSETAPAQPSPISSTSPKLITPLTLTLGLVILLIGILGGGGAVYLLQQNNSMDMDHMSMHMTPTPTMAMSTPTPIATATPQPTTDEYADWSTYTHPSSYYTFKYPANAKVNRDIVQDDFDIVTITLDGHKIASISRYADGAGCDPIDTHPITIGQTAATSSTCGNSAYTVNVTVDKLTAAKQGITLAKAAPNSAIVTAYWGTGYDTQIDLWAKSLTGLTVKP